MKKPSGRKPRQQKQKRQRNAAAVSPTRAVVQRDEIGPRAGALHRAGSGATPLSGFSVFYEGLMGTPPQRPARVRGVVAGGTGALAYGQRDDDTRDFMMLSLPILAMMMVGVVTQALKSERSGAEFSVPFPAVMAPVAPTIDAGARAERVALAPVRELPPILAERAAPIVVAEAKPQEAAAGRAVELNAALGAVPSYPALGPVEVGPSRYGDGSVVGPAGQQLALLAPVPPLDVVTRPDLTAPALVPLDEGAAAPPVVSVEVPKAEDHCVAPVGLLGGRGLGKGELAAPVSASLSGEAYGLALAVAAREQLSGLTIYNDKYRRIAYPMGDVQALYGVCTDVIIRAYRGVGVDLQQRVHEAGMSGGDASIGHRRTETLRRYLARFGAALPVTSVAEDYQPGDIVTYYRPQNRYSRSHIALVSDVVAPSGRYMILHNRGWGPQLEDGLFVDQMTGHYRYRPVDPARGLAVAVSDGALGAVAVARLPVPQVAGRAKSKAQTGRVRTLDGVTAIGLGR